MGGFVALGACCVGGAKSRGGGTGALRSRRFGFEKFVVGRSLGHAAGQDQKNKKNSGARNHSLNLVEGRGEGQKSLVNSP